MCSTMYACNMLLVCMRLRWYVWYVEHTIRCMYCTRHYLSFIFRKCLCIFIILEYFLLFSCLRSLFSLSFFVLFLFFFFIFFFFSFLFFFFIRNAHFNHADIPEFLISTTKRKELRFEIDLFTQCVSTWDKETEKNFYIARFIMLYL